MAEYFEWSGSGKNLEFVIEDGWTPKQVAAKLEEEKVIKSDKLFILKFKSEAADMNLKAGVISIKKGDTYSDIINKIIIPKEEPKATVTLMIPEGFSAEMIALRCENNGLCTREEFLDALDDEYDYEFIKYIPDGEYKYKLQGFLFPNTYEFYDDVTAHEIIDRMLAYFNNAYSNNVESYDDLFRHITIASLIEREAALDSEREIISGVMYNRLEIGMPLQIDASAVYAVTDGMYDLENVTGEHMKVESGYNTYRVSGLPTGPICNPGLKSILAAVKPQSHEFLYYHTDTAKGDGSHIFTKTYGEHVATIN